LFLFWNHRNSSVQNVRILPSACCCILSEVLPVGYLYGEDESTVGPPGLRFSRKYTREWAQATFRFSTL